VGVDEFFLALILVVIFVLYLQKRANGDDRLGHSACADCLRIIRFQDIMNPCSYCRCDGLLLFEDPLDVEAIQRMWRSLPDEQVLTQLEIFFC